MDSRLLEGQKICPMRKVEAAIGEDRYCRLNAFGPSHLFCKSLNPSVLIFVKIEMSGNTQGMRQGYTVKLN